MHDRRAYSAVLTEGSIGFGRGFVEGWWTSRRPGHRRAGRSSATSARSTDRATDGASLTGWATDRRPDTCCHATQPRAEPRRHRCPLRHRQRLLRAVPRRDDDVLVGGLPDAGHAPRRRQPPQVRPSCSTLLGVDAPITTCSRSAPAGAAWPSAPPAPRAATSRRRRSRPSSSREAQRRVADAGLGDRVTLLDNDWRDLDGGYDRVVSIEMIEAVDWRDYDDYFATIERLPRPRTASLQSRPSCSPTSGGIGRRTPRTSSAGSSSRTASCRRSARSASRCARATRMHVVDVEDLTGRTTPRRCDAGGSGSTPVSTRSPALGLDARFQRLWRFYLAYCEAGFLERHCTVVQMVLAGREWRADMPGSGSDRRRRRRGCDVGLIGRGAPPVTTMLTPSTTEAPPTQLGDARDARRGSASRRTRRTAGSCRRSTPPGSAWPGGRRWRSART